MKEQSVLGQALTKADFLLSALAVMGMGAVVGALLGILLGLMSWHRTGSLVVAIASGFTYATALHHVFGAPGGKPVIAGIIFGVAAGAAVLFFGGIVARA